jgi:hypothetical protein
MSANKKESSSRGKAPFVAELYDIVEAGPTDLVSWTANGQAVIIWDSDRWEEVWVVFHMAEYLISEWKF